MRPARSIIACRPGLLVSYDKVSFPTGALAWSGPSSRAPDDRRTASTQGDAAPPASIRSDGGSEHWPSSSLSSSSSLAEQQAAPRLEDPWADELL